MSSSVSQAVALCLLSFGETFDGVLCYVSGRSRSFSLLCLKFLRKIWQWCPRICLSLCLKRHKLYLQSPNHLLAISRSKMHQEGRYKAPYGCLQEFQTEVRATVRILLRSLPQSSIRGIKWTQVCLTEMTIEVRIICLALIDQCVFIPDSQCSGFCRR